MMAHSEIIFGNLFYRAIRDSSYTLTAAPLVGIPSPALFYTQPGCGGAGAERATGTIAAGQSGVTLYVVPRYAGPVSVLAQPDKGALVESIPVSVQQSALSLTGQQLNGSITYKMLVGLYQSNLTTAMSNIDFISPINVKIEIVNCSECQLALTENGPPSQSLTLSLSANQIHQPFYLAVPTGNSPVQIQATSLAPGVLLSEFSVP